MHATETFRPRGRSIGACRDYFDVIASLRNFNCEVLCVRLYPPDVRAKARNDTKDPCHGLRDQPRARVPANPIAADNKPATIAQTLSSPNTPPSRISRLTAPVSVFAT